MDFDGDSNDSHGGPMAGVTEMYAGRSVEDECYESDHDYNGATERHESGVKRPAPTEHDDDDGDDDGDDDDDDKMEIQARQQSSALSNEAAAALPKRRRRTVPSPASATTAAPLLSHLAFEVRTSTATATASASDIAKNVFLFLDGWLSATRSQYAAAESSWAQWWRCRTESDGTLVVRGTLPTLGADEDTDLEHLAQCAADRRAYEAKVAWAMADAGSMGGAGNERQQERRLQAAIARTYLNQHRLGHIVFFAAAAPQDALPAALPLRAVRRPVDDAELRPHIEWAVEAAIARLETLWGGAKLTDVSASESEPGLAEVTVARHPPAPLGEQLFEGDDVGSATLWVTCDGRVEIESLEWPDFGKTPLPLEGDQRCLPDPFAIGNDSNETQAAEFSPGDIRDEEARIKRWVEQRLWFAKLTFATRAAKELLKRAAPTAKEVATFPAMLAEVTVPEGKEEGARVFKAIQSERARWKQCEKQHAQLEQEGYNRFVWFWLNRHAASIVAEPDHTPYVMRTMAATEADPNSGYRKNIEGVEAASWTPPPRRATFVSKKNAHEFQLAVRLGGSGDPKVPNVETAFAAWLRLPSARTFARRVFNPFPQGHAEAAKSNELNMWTGVGRSKADVDEAVAEKYPHLTTEAERLAFAQEQCRLRLDLVAELCGANDPREMTPMQRKSFAYLLNWLGLKLQQPWARPGVCVVLTGKQGIGKSLVVNMTFEAAFGQHFKTTANDSDVFGEFNGFLKNCAVCFFEEGELPKDGKSVRKMKHLITNKDMSVRDLYQSAIPLRNHLAWIMATNSTNPVFTDDSVRRWFIVEGSDKRAPKHGDDEHTAAMADHFCKVAAVDTDLWLYLLYHRDLSQFNVRNVPYTDKLDANKEMSLRGVDSFLQRALETVPRTGQHANVWPADWFEDANPDAPPNPKQIHNEVTNRDILAAYNAWTSSTASAAAGKTFWRYMKEADAVVSMGTARSTLKSVAEMRATFRKRGFQGAWARADEDVQPAPL